MKPQTKFIRKKHIIRDVDGNVLFEGRSPHGGASINAAKRESRRLQAANGGLGMGSLRVDRSR